MARPREFDREIAVERAMNVFWAKGFAATSTEDLVDAMGIGRQSLYSAFGDKRRLYFEALDTYQQATMAGHMKRLSAPASPVVGIRDLLLGLIADDDKQRANGCMGVGAIAEFGTCDAKLAKLRVKAAPLLLSRLVYRLREGQTSGELDPGMNSEEAANFILMTMTGIQLAARGGAGVMDLKRMVRFATNRLKAR